MRNRTVYAIAISLHILTERETRPRSVLQCRGPDASHVDGPDCGHEAVTHGDHIDYLVDVHLHHPHSSHRDDHGPLAVVSS